MGSFRSADAGRFFFKGEKYASQATGRRHRRRRFDGRRVRLLRRRRQRRGRGRRLVQGRHLPARAASRPRCGHRRVQEVLRGRRRHRRMGREERQRRAGQCDVDRAELRELRPRPRPRRRDSGRAGRRPGDHRQAGALHRGHRPRRGRTRQVQRSPRRQRHRHLRPQPGRRPARTGQGGQAGREDRRIVYSSGEVNSQVQVDLAKEAAKGMGLEIKEATIANSGELGQAVDSLARSTPTTCPPTTTSSPL